MGLIIGEGPAKDLETKKSVRYGEQKVVSTETDVKEESSSPVSAPGEGKAEVKAQKKGKKTKKGE